MLFLILFSYIATLYAAIRAADTDLPNSFFVVEALRA